MQALKFDLSDINIQSKWLTILFRGFSALSQSLNSLEIDLFNTQLLTMDVVGILIMLQSFTQLRSLSLNFRRIYHLKMNDEEFLLEFFKLVESLVHLQDFKLNLSQIEFANDNLALKQLFYSLSKKKLREFSLSLRHSELSNKQLALVIEQLIQFEALEKLCLNVGYNHFTSGIVNDIIQLSHKMPKLTKLDIYIDGPDNLISQKDFYALQMAGLEFLKTQSYEFSVHLPLASKKIYKKQMQKLDLLTVNGKYIWYKLIK